MNFKLSQASLSFFSIGLSFIASSHHWLHMGLLMLLGGSTNMMATMNGVMWIRRVMIVETLVTALYSVYRLMKHRSREPLTMVFTGFSVLLSFGFIIYTLVDFGW
ncbi:hypothetical protein JOC85_003740 [Bacillus mesophilus]|uniref:Uncharacterized protein n=1 Tax=Bacillus mesophilus TaxID=1808955 RepID=A0A6M0QE56_9BACI|nr:hypothetical protein [Bacillus mesophilus]MBM7662929.1 hypothetical protein [Bacillus mesophilus]NEY73518.1 hypothetical protein [Bacillus mesophilus]